MAVSHRHVRGRNVRPEWVFLVLALIMGGCLALLTPAGGMLDEPNHIARAWAVAHGDWVAQPLDAVGYTSPLDVDMVDAGLWGGMMDSAMYDMAQSNMIFFHNGDGSDRSSYAFPTWDTPGVSGAKAGDDGRRLIAYSNTAVNTPFVYLPHALGYWLARVFTTDAYALVVCMRLAGLAACIGVIFACICLIPVGKWVLATISLIPSTVISMSSVTADSMTYATCVAFTTFVLRCALVDKTPSRADLAGLSCATLALALVKVSYLPLLLLLILIPLLNPSARSRVPLLPTALAALGACLLFLGWYALISGINTGAMFNVGASPTLQKDVVLDHPLRYLRILAAQIPAQDYFNIESFQAYDIHGHVIYSGWMTALTLCCAVTSHDFREYGIDRLRRCLSRVATVCLLAIACVFILVCTALYLQYTPVASDTIDGIQPRYFLPVIFAILLPVYANGCCADTRRIRGWLPAVALVVSVVLTLYVLVTSLYV